jgi:cell division protein ZapA
MSESESNNKVMVAIFGQTYTIKGDAPPEYIATLADYVNDKMEDVARNNSGINPLQIAILVALNIADEYYQVKDLKSESISDLEKKTNALISMLDEGLIGDIFSRV